MESKLAFKVNAGLNTLRTLFIKDKALQQQHRGVLEALNSLSSTSQDAVTHVIQMFYDLPTSVHSANIMRWYGEYRNDGAYNTDFYAAVLGRTKSLIETQRKLLEMGKAMLPERATIAELHKQAGRKSG